MNAAGLHSFKINAMAGVEDDMTIKTCALRHEVAHDIISYLEFRSGRQSIL